MKDNFNKNLTSVLENTPSITKYRFDLDNGYGNMSIYHLFSGIDLIFNDFNADNCNQLNSSINYTDYIIINHCRKGRFETSFKGKYIYISEGDLVFSSGTRDYVHDFPLGYYNGLQVLINLKKAQKSIDKMIGEDILDIRNLSQKIRDNDFFGIFRSNEDIKHIISELYDVEESIKIAYYKLKVVELLLFLNNSPMNDIDDFPSLKEENTIKIKEIQSYLIAHISENITLEDLSKKFNISRSSLKNHFKTMYGKPLITWRREYRLNQASILLKQSNIPIADISKQIGYKDQSKFTKAFKEYYGLTPNRYRKRYCSKNGK